jgi:peptidyl-prolyl cis-trans isomerase C
MRFFHRSAWLASLAFMGATVMAQEGTNGQTTATQADKVPTGVAATVNGQPIMEVAVYRGLKRLPADKQAEARTEIVNYLIDNIVLDQHLQQLRIDIDKKAVDAKVDQIKEEIKKSGQTFDKAMAQLMLTEEELRTQLASELRWEKYCAGQFTEKDLRDLFDKNIEMFDGTMVRARHILLTPPPGDARAAEQAKQQLLKDKQLIEEEVSNGLAKLPATTSALTRELERTRLLNAAFAAVASKESACPSKDDGGDVKWFGRTGSMVEPFAKEAFALKPGAMSDVVPTQFGLHLILVTERKQGQTTKFEDVKDVVKEVYCDRLRDTLCAKLRPEAKVEIKSQAKP